METYRRISGLLLIFSASLWADDVRGPSTIQCDSYQVGDCNPTKLGLLIFVPPGTPSQGYTPITITGTGSGATAQAACNNCNSNMLANWPDPAGCYNSFVSSYTCGPCTNVSNGGSEPCDKDVTTVVPPPSNILGINSGCTATENLFGGFSATCSTNTVSIAINCFPADACSGDSGDAITAPRSTRRSAKRRRYRRNDVFQLPRHPVQQVELYHQQKAMELE
jgi:hypothetical protein